jgi:hypothetical protein
MLTMHQFPKQLEITFGSVGPASSDVPSVVAADDEDAVPPNCFSSFFCRSFANRSFRSSASIVIDFSNGDFKNFSLVSLQFANLLITK